MAARRTLVVLMSTAALACGALLGIEEVHERDAPDARVADAVAEDVTPLGEGGASADCGADASFTSDPKNCGACGHDCAGGTCTDSKCDPLQIADQQPGTHWVVLDDANVYWTNGTSIHACPKSGCLGAPLPVVTGRTNINELTVAGGNVYWTECISEPSVGGAYTCAATGCSGAPKVLADGSCMTALAVDEPKGLFYFSSVFEIFRCALGTCSTASAALLGSQRLGYVASMTLVGGEPVWLEGQLGLFQCTSPSCAPVGTRMIAQSLRNANMPPSIVNGTAYFANYMGGPEQRFAPAEIGLTRSGSLMRAPMTQDGGNAEVLTAAHAVTSAVADSTAVRFTDFLSGAILSCPPSGCDAGTTPLVVGQGKPFALAQDDGAIYWANWGDGRVMKLAK